MGFSSFFRKKKGLIVFLASAVVLAGVVIYLAQIGVISADTATPATYSYTGTVKTSTGHRPINVIPTYGTMTVDRYYKSNACTGTWTTASAQSVVLDAGKFTLTKLQKGCYTGRVGGQLANYETVNDTYKLVVPAVTRVTNKNFNSANLSFKLIGSFAREGAPVVVSPVATYTISGVLKDKDGKPMASAKLVNSAPQYSKLMVGDPTKCDVNQTVAISAQATTNASGAFTMVVPQVGCYTLKITPSAGGVAFTSGSGAPMPSGSGSSIADSVLITVSPNGTTTTTVTSTNGNTVTVTITTTAPKTPTPTPKTPTPTPTPSPGTGSTVVLNGKITLSGGHFASSAKIDQGLVGSNGMISWTNNVASVSSGVFTINYSGVPADNGTKHTQRYMLRAHDVDGCNFASGLSDYSPVVPDPRVNPNTVTMDLTCTSTPRQGGIYGKVKFNNVNQSNATLDLYYKDPTTGKYGSNSIQTTHLVDSSGYSFTVYNSGTYQIKAGGGGLCNGHPGPLAATKSNIVVPLSKDSVPIDIILECAK